MAQPAFTEEKFDSWWTAWGEEQLCEILYWRWNPIGPIHGAFPNTRGEYDHPYPAEIAAALKRGAGKQEVEELLLTFETQNMGLPSTPQADGSRREVAELITELWFPQSLQRWMEDPAADWRHF